MYSHFYFLLEFFLWHKSFPLFLDSYSTLITNAIASAALRKVFLSCVPTSPLPFLIEPLLIYLLLETVRYAFIMQYTVRIQGSVWASGVIGVVQR